MNGIKQIDSLKEYNDWWNVETRHKLVEVDRSPFFLNPVSYEPYTTNLYMICLINDSSIDHLKYGCQQYTFEKDSIIFFAPGQVIKFIKDGYNHRFSGRGLYFHPDLLTGTPLARHIHDYPFFSYHLTEGLHITSDERKDVNYWFDIIDREIAFCDTQSDSIIVSTITLLLEYCIRFYQRQTAVTDNEVATDNLLVQCENIVQNGIKRMSEYGEKMPSIAEIASMCNISPNHFCRKIKSLTGKSPYEHIQEYKIREAKIMLSQTDMSMKKISELLGYGHNQNFAKTFKKHTGYSPSDYKKTLGPTDH